MKDKYVVLLSSGLDSTVNLYEAKRQGEVACVLHFQYGQRAAARELERSQKLTRDLGLQLTVVDLSWFSAFTSSSLINKNSLIPGKNEVQIDSHEESLKTAKSVWVPNRNGIFLNVAAGFAESLGASFIVPGFNIEEASTFPDNSKAFLESIDASLSFSTANQVKTKCFTTDLDKPQIMKRALELGVPLKDLWPCYHAEEKWCGECESCQRFHRALRSQKVLTEGWFLK